MFVRLAQIENGSIDGQIEALKYQHVQGRAYAASIGDSLDGYADGDPAKIHTVHESAAAYASLLRLPACPLPREAGRGKLPLARFLT